MTPGCLHFDKKIDVQYTTEPYRKRRDGAFLRAFGVVVVANVDRRDYFGRGEIRLVCRQHEKMVERDCNRAYTFLAIYHVRQILLLQWRQRHVLDVGVVRLVGYRNTSPSITTRLISIVIVDLTFGSLNKFIHSESFSFS